MGSTPLREVLPAKYMLNNNIIIFIIEIWSWPPKYMINSNSIIVVIVIMTENSVKKWAALPLGGVCPSKYMVDNNNIIINYYFCHRMVKNGRHSP